MDLETYGWDSRWQAAWDESNITDGLPARIVLHRGQQYAAVSEAGAQAAVAAGSLRHAADSAEDLPAAGDWVVLGNTDGGGLAPIRSVLPRRSAFIRRQAGPSAQGQVVAANVGTVFLVSGLDRDYNLRRIERYLTAAYDSGAAPVVVLNKADLRADLADAVEQVEEVALGVPVLPVSAREGGGVSALREHLGPGKTAAFLGSSGVGKSTLINSLLGGESMATGAVREDDQRGRHTTTHRELLLLPSGEGMLIDTPGMRELGLWSEDGLSQAFGDVEALAAACRFRDCTHAHEPGCAVVAAVDDGTLPQARLEGYRKLQREAQYMERKKNVHARLEEQRKWKQIHKEVRRHYRER